jgi:drug/metabolite transporter (DMT)-like permease
LHGDVLVSFRGTRFNAVDMGLGYIAIIISAICYGCNPLFSAMGTELGFSVPWQLAIRFLGTSLPIGMYLIVRKRPLLLPWKTLWRILLSGIGTFGMTSVLLYESYRFAPSGIDTTIHFLYPVFVMVLSVLMGREKPQWRLVVAVVIALVALLCIIQPWTVRGARGEGVLLALASSLTFSCYVLFLGRNDIRKVDASVLVFWLCLSAGLFCLVLAMAVDGPLAKSSVAMTPANFWFLLLQPLVTSVAASTLFAFGAQRIGGTRASILSMFEPATAVVVGALVLGESLSSWFGMGFLLLLCSVYLTVRGQKR